uniref:Conotoxin n=1 Tax=Conus praecellens TaxID=128530 RepID=A0A291C2A6_CONPC|nr:conotoxin [Conus praecellens]
MNTAGRLLLCLALGLVFESLGKTVADDVDTHRDTDPDDKDLRDSLKIVKRTESDCGGVPCKFGCCKTEGGKKRCRELGCKP